jgi:diguanylate cyclase (GGDEF)-like protein/PAS domain S-box-containing protein
MMLHAWILGFLVAGGGAVVYGLTARLRFSLRQREELHTRFQVIFDQTAGGVVFIEPESWDIIAANAGFMSFIGRPLAELTDRNLLDLMRLENKDAENELARTLVEKREIPFRHRNGTSVFAKITAVPVRYQGRESLALFTHDTTEHRRLQSQLFFQANHDHLTGLPNRNLLADRLTLGIADALRRQQRLAVALIDIDNFKSITERLGHQTGDQLLTILAERLRKSCRQSDTLARFGDDVFAHLCNGLNSAEDEIKVVNVLRKQLTQPVKIDGQEIFFTASIGIAQYPEDGHSGDELIRRADTALYHVKSRGKNGFEFYNEEMNRMLREHNAIEAQLRHAIAREELSLYYQPKICLVEGRITGVEALLRWNNAELGEVLPSRFIPIAEETGLIVELGEWVLRTAVGQVLAWIREGIAPLRVAVNLSARQLVQDNFVDTVRELLVETGLDPDLLELELTESHLMRNVAASIGRMRELKTLGISLSIDDFGTEYSSLNYVSQFPIDRMKIDRSFMDNLLEDSRKEAVVRMIVAMAHSLGMAVIAEGVETRSQLQFLSCLACDEAQGFYLCRPVPTDTLGEMLRETGLDFSSPHLMPINRAPLYAEC